MMMGFSSCEASLEGMCVCFGLLEAWDLNLFAGGWDLVVDDRALRFKVPVVPSDFLAEGLGAPFEVGAFLEGFLVVGKSSSLACLGLLEPLVIAIIEPLNVRNTRACRKMSG